MNCIGGDELPPEIRPKSPSPPFWEEREGPTPEAWEGEVGGAADQDICATGNISDTIDRMHA